MFRTFRETIGFSTSRYQWIGFVGMTKPETIVLFPSNMRLSCNTSLQPRWNRWPRETSTSAAPRQAGYPKTSGFTGMVRDFEVRKYLEIYKSNHSTSGDDCRFISLTMPVGEIDEMNPILQKRTVSNTLSNTLIWGPKHCERTQYKDRSCFIGTLQRLERRWAKGLMGGSD